MRKSTRRKRQIYFDGRKLESITLHYQKIPTDQFTALPIEQQYCLLVLGHVHDELNWIQRMAFLATRPVRYRREVFRQGQMMQSLMLARLFFAKLLEFSNLIESQNSPVKLFITENYRPGKIDEGKQRVNELLDQFNAEKWIRLARNKHFMHYPSLNDVKATLEDPQIRWDLEIYHGTRSNNTFYPTSDVLANYAWFRLVNPGAPMEGLGDALDLLSAISRLTLSTLEESIGYYVDRNLMPLEQNERIKLNVPSGKGKSLDYFLSLK